jgi:deoxyadenosine/deoxycytidine kinase
MIVVGGMIGSGKTSYTQMLATAYAFEPFYESEGNPVLSKYYNDPINYGFMSQIYYAATRYSSLRIASAHPRNIVDRSIYEDKLFAQVNYELGYMTDEEKMIYDTLMNELISSFNQKIIGNQKTLYLYLKASFDTVLKRIDMTGKTVDEQKKLTEYYKTLHIRYDDWVSKYYTPSQMLIIDVDKYDIKKPEDKAEVINMVSLRLQALGL